MHGVQARIALLIALLSRCSRRYQDQTMSRELHIVGFQIGRETYGVPITRCMNRARAGDYGRAGRARVSGGSDQPPGKIVSVMDLRKRFGQKQTELKRRNRILVVEHSGRLAGLIVTPRQSGEDSGGRC